MSKALCILDFYSFFNKEISKLKFIVGESKVLSNFFREKIGDLKPLTPKQIMLLWKNVQGADMASLFHEIYKKEECDPQNKLSLLQCYKEEVRTVVSIELLFSNWYLSDLIALNKIDSDFSDEFDEVVSDNQMDATEANFYNYQFFTVFLKAGGNLREVIVDYAIESNKNLVNNMLDEVIGQYS